MDHVNNAVYADWLDEVIAVAGGAAAVRAIPRLARLEYARAAEPGATLVAAAWPDYRGWSCRVTDAQGADLLRARLEPLAAHDEREPEVPEPGA
jgi:acyl-ACP thioesterase